MERRGAVLTDSDALPRVDDLSRRPEFTRVMLTEPTHFSVDYQINPYMIADVDHERATSQWRRLVERYRELTEVSILDPDEVWTRLNADRDTPPTDLPDIVFCSNHALPGPDGERFILADMACDERMGEPRYFREWAAAADHDVVRLETPAVFEGNGDARWHPGRELLWGGYGQRTQIEVYEEISDRFDVPVIPLELTDEDYYHLDVCFSPLDERTALVCSDALTEKGLTKIDRVFDTIIDVSPKETRSGLACNCHSVDGYHIVIDASNDATAERLAANGYQPIRVPTEEFIKAGGSVSCLVLPYG